jgi:hypothetical protein
MTVYWVWFGPAVTRAWIDRDLANMKRASISGATILPVYPLSTDDPAKGIRNAPFLSEEFLNLVAYAAGRAKELGLTLDLTLGSGWPYGGPWITPQLGGRTIRLRDASQPLKPGEEMVGRFGQQVVVSVPTNMRVKRPALGDEGLAVDPYNPASLTRHLDEAGAKLIQATRATPVRGFWCDSLEIYDANWTGDFPEQFRQRRGYDLHRHLPALFGPATPDAAQVRHDFWQTLSESAADNFYKPLQQWCHAHGVQLRAEPYGQPPVSLGSFAYVDLPVGEHYEWRMLNATRWSAAGGHLFGKNVIDAEAWTWIGLPNRFADSLEQLKLASDMHFVSGANALMAVSYVCAPPGADPSYWVSYWGPFLNEHQPWWRYFPLLSRYVQRVSWVLRQGRPVSEVGLYLPIDDVFAATSADQGLNLYFGVRERLHGRPIPEFGLGNSVTGDTALVSTLINNGYSFDCIDSATLPQARIEGKRLRMGVTDVAVVVLPNLVGMPLADLEKLAEFVHGGGIVLATRRLPEVAYGLRTHERDTARLRHLVTTMFAAEGYGRGRAVLVNDEPGDFLRALKRLLPPDLVLDPGDHDVAFVHRRLDRQDFYFVANFADKPKSLKVRFKADGERIQLWDAMTGDDSDARDGTLHLDPYGSQIIRIQPGTSHQAGRRRAVAQQVIPVAGPWRLEVPGHRTREMHAPGLWTEDKNLLHFSGTGTYSTTFQVKPPAHAGRVILDLGEVHEIAEVRCNGKEVGVAWKRPYTLDVTEHITPGANRLEVRVTNLLINAVLGRPQPDYKRLHEQFGQRFPDPEEWKSGKPLPSGLAGPVRLLIEPGGP